MKPLNFLFLIFVLLPQFAFANTNLTANLYLRIECLDDLLQVENQEVKTSLLIDLNTSSARPDVVIGGGHTDSISYKEEVFSLSIEISKKQDVYAIVSYLWEAGSDVSGMYPTVLAHGRIELKDLTSVSKFTIGSSAVKKNCSVQGTVESVSIP